MRGRWKYGVGLGGAVVAVGLGLLLYYQWDLLVGAEVVIEPKVGKADALRTWNRFSSNYLTVDEVPAEFAILADLDEDDVVGASDARLAEAGQVEWMRANDAVCNGRSRVHDRTPWLDDDLQCVLVAIPEGMAGEAVIDRASDDAQYIEAFQSDWLDARAPVRWPLRLSDHPAFAEGGRVVPLWLRAPVGTPSDKVLRFELVLREEAKPDRHAELRLQVVDGLGHPGYFAAVRDYLMERDRADAPRAKVFLDSVECASWEDPDDYEMMRLVAMRHEVTRFEVLETYHDTSFAQPRIKNIFAAARRHPEQTVIVNGSYFHVDTGASIPHGRTCLGAVVHDHQVSPATARHWWFTYPNDGRPQNAEWFYTSYCLVQEEDRAGILELREEPREPNPYVPMIRRDGEEVPAHMALGGINTIHNFIHSVRGRKSHVWMARVPGADGDDEHKLVCLSMSDTMQSTSYCGGPAFRQKLRDSGLVIEEGDAAKGIPPGTNELAYFDGGASIAMAVNLNGDFEYPTFTSRHEPRNRHVHVNNYAMFSVEED